MARIVIVLLITMTISWNMFAMISSPEAQKENIPVAAKTTTIISTKNVAEKFCICLNNFLVFNFLSLKKPNGTLSSLFKVSEKIMQANVETIFSKEQLKNYQEQWSACEGYMGKLSKNQQYTIRKTFIPSLPLFQKCLTLLMSISPSSDVKNAQLLFAMIEKKYQKRLSIKY